jgi:hypothetical protein
MKRITKNPGFKIPEHYFEEFGKKILDKVGQIDDSATIRTFPKNEGFIVPQAYFENLNEKIFERLDKKENDVIPLYRYKKIYYAIAAVAAGLLLFFGLGLSFEKQLTFSDLASQDIETYFQNNEMDISFYEIAEMFPVDQLEVDDILNDGIQDAAILDYLDNNTDNLEELNLNYNE